MPPGFVAFAIQDDNIAWVACKLFDRLSIITQTRNHRSGDEMIVQAESGSRISDQHAAGGKVVSEPEIGVTLRVG